MHLEAVIERVGRCNWRPWLSKYRDALGGYNRVTQRCTWMPWMSKLGDALGGRDWASLEMHLEAVIERVERYTLRP
jgi:hypothetical protein